MTHKEARKRKNKIKLSEDKAMNRTGDKKYMLKLSDNKFKITKINAKGFSGKSGQHA